MLPGVLIIGGERKSTPCCNRAGSTAFAYSKIQRVLAPFHLPKRTWMLSAASSVVLTTCDERNSTPGRSRAGSTAPTSLRLTLKLVGCSAPSSAPAGAAATNPSSLRQGGRGSLRVCCRWARVCLGWAGVGGDGWRAVVVQNG